MANQVNFRPSLVMVSALLCIVGSLRGEEQDPEKRLFAKGPAPAKGENGKWGFRAPDGSWAVEAKYLEVKPFQADLAAVREKETWGYIDATGNWKIPARFSWAGEFSENLAPASEGDRLTGKFGYIDRQGRWAIEPEYNWARPFQGGYGAVKDGSKWGFVDGKGKLVVEADFDQVGGFSEGLAPVQKSGPPGDKKTWIYISPDGKSPFETKFAWAGEFSEGLARVQLEDRILGKFGYISIKGDLAIPPEFDEASNFQNGHATVRVGNQTRSIDTKGKARE